MISMDKKYRTRDGRNVRLYAVYGGGIRPVHGAIWNDIHWTSHAWDTNGWHRSKNTRKLDLIEVQTAEDVAAEVVEKIAGQGYADVTAAKVCQALRDAGKLRDGE